MRRLAKIALAVPIVLWLIELPFVVIIAMTGARADITAHGKFDLEIGESVQLLGHYSQSAERSELIHRLGVTSSPWSAASLLFRWRVVRDTSASTMIESQRSNLTGRASIHRGRLVALSPGAVRVEVSILGSRASMTFLVQPHGVSLSAQPPTLTVVKDSVAFFDVVAQAATGPLPATFPPYTDSLRCVEGPAPNMVSFYGYPVTFAENRWRFGLQGREVAHCEVVMALGDGKVVIPFEVISAGDKIVAGR